MHSAQQLLSYGFDSSFGFFLQISIFIVSFRNDFQMSDLPHRHSGGGLRYRVPPTFTTEATRDRFPPDPNHPRIQPWLRLEKIRMRKYRKSSEYKRKCFEEKVQVWAAFHIPDAMPFPHPPCHTSAQCLLWAPVTALFFFGRGRRLKQQGGLAVGERESFGGASFCTCRKGQHPLVHTEGVSG